VVAQGVSSVKLIQINVWLGNLMPSLFKFLEQEQPDIICTQEILSTSLSLPMLPNYQIQERLSERFAYQFFAPTLSFMVAGSEVVLGNAVYSQHPIENPRTVFTYGEYLARQEASNFEDNVRNLQLCEIHAGDKVLTVANHHGYHELDPLGSAQTIESMQRAAAALASVNGPLIICGDFNINPASPAMREFDNLKLHNLTTEYQVDSTLSPASRVEHPVICDYIFTSDGIKVKSFEAADQIVSDHKALTVEFDLES
jgi:endonuclease/exonuclease/phosphatase family metal-dependent hydrolase